MRGRHAALGLAMALSCAAIFASPPPNDTCAGSVAVPSLGPFPYLSAVYDAAEATTAGDPAAPCQPSVSHGTWFRFTPAVSTEYTFSVCGDAPTATTLEDTVIAVFGSPDGTCGGALTPLIGGCDDDGCPLTSLQSVVANLTLQANTTYFIIIYEYGSSPPAPNRSSVQLLVTQAPPPPPPPPYDLGTGAETIPGAGPFPVLTAVTQDIAGATSIGDPPAPACQPNGTRSLWYRFTPAASGGYEFSTCADAPTATTVDDTILGVYRSSDGTCAGVMTQVPGGCDDNGCGVEAAQAVIPNLGLEGGVTYYVLAQKLGSARPSAGSTAVQVRVTRTDPPPPNDRCESAEVLTGAGPFPVLSTIAPDLRYATTTGDPALPPTCQSNVSRSVWYRFAPGATRLYDFSLCSDMGTASTLDDTVLSVYTSSDERCSGTLTQIYGGCDDDGCVAETAQSVLRRMSLFAGRTYFILVQQYGQAPPAVGQTAVQVRLDDAGPVASDADGDGVANAVDCSPGDPTVWSPPGEATGLVFTSATSMTWVGPAVPGAATPLFDLVRSSNPRDFSKSVCVAQDLDAPGADDPESPAGLFSYLV